MSVLPRNLLLSSLSLVFALAMPGCHSNPQQPAANSPSGTQGQSAQDQAQTTADQGDPASANLAPVSNATSTSYAPQQSSQPSYSDESAPPPQAPPPAQYQQAQYEQDQPGEQYGDQYGDYDEQAADYAPQPPPPLPEYDQPPCPGDDYIWTPGYWDYDPDGYYWVPGAWVQAPYQGALWTPGFWAFDTHQRRYGFHHGYWGRHVGYYGGINYGFGYTGYGYQGGYWNQDHFNYNRTVNHVDNHVQYVYNRTVVNNTYNRISYNGGSGGVNVRPRPAEVAAFHEQHAPPMSSQVQHVRQARSDRANFAAVNHNRPATVAVTRPLQADHNIRPPARVAMPVAPQPQQRGVQQQPVPGAQNRPGQQQRPQEPVRPGAPQPNAPRPNANQPNIHQPNGREPGRENVPNRTAPQPNVPQHNQPIPQPNNRPANRPEQPAPPQRTGPQPHAAPQPHQEQPRQIPSHPEQPRPIPPHAETPRSAPQPQRAAPERPQPAPPAARPAPPPQRQAPRPQEQQRPAPQARPAEPPHPAPPQRQPQARPEPQRPAPQQPHPAPERKPSDHPDRERPQ